MKRTISIALIALLFAVAGFAADSAYPSLMPKSAKTMGLGGVFTSLPSAEYAFYGNPAAFASTKPSLTLAAVDVWAYVKPTAKNIGILQQALKDIDNEYPSLFSLMQGNGIGAGASVNALSYAGKNFGIGFYGVTDEYAAGNSLPEAVLGSDTQVNAVVGVGAPLIKLDGFRFSVGGDLRLFYRLRASNLSLASIVKAALDPNATDTAVTDALMGLKVSSGFGLAADLGASLVLGDSLTFGISIRDIAPGFTMWEGTLKQFTDTINTTGSLPEADVNSPKANYLPNVAAGIAWTPRFVPGLIDPYIYAELQDPVSVIREKSSALNLLHAGAELRLLSIITVRGGINRGWLSVGAGVKLLFIEANASVFTEELGQLPGDKPRSGISLQAAIRF